MAKISNHEIVSKMHPFGITSLRWFVIGCGLLLFLSVFKFDNVLIATFAYGNFGILVSFFGFGFTKADPNVMIPEQVRLRGFLLGLMFSIGILIFKGETYQNFGIYLCFLSFFHFSEFFCTAVTNPTTLDIQSFLIDHSKEYGIGVAATLLEYFAECYFFSGLKNSNYSIGEGALTCILGELIRKGAMITLWNDFTHLLRHKKVDGHRLKTNGLYSYFRHPSYAGALFWFLGLQTILCNPICFVVYGIGISRLFAQRIYYEESCLIEFFPEYVQYQKRVPNTGVPFAYGCLDSRAKLGGKRQHRN
ncbi:unnamed protein product [Orchesella dallaii]|uniref:Protein-S-isoprenylcysteine O-methyltransferase n=1 Tax=Orchesella dallaii TaxID=48710 RepID=A0ABP1QYL6_9HEXA